MSGSLFMTDEANAVHIAAFLPLWLGPSEDPWALIRPLRI